MFSYLVAFGGAVVYARLLGKEEFGIYSFANNIIQFFLLVNGFGVASGVLQFVSMAKSFSTKQSYLRYSMVVGLLFNLLLSAGIIFYTYYIPIPVHGAKIVLLWMAFFPIGRLYLDVHQAFLRAIQQNKLLAKFLITNNLILVGLNIIGILYAGIIGFIIATYLSYIIIVLVSLFIFKLPNIFLLKHEPIKRKEFIRYSGYAISSTAFSQLLFILDIFILSYLVKDAANIAVYKVATIIPFALNFIPGVVVMFFYPYFAQNLHNLAYVKELYNKIQKAMLAFSFLVSLVLIIFAKPLILLIFGANYAESVLPFQILMGGFWILASFRTLAGNVLASLGKAKFTMVLNLFIVIINIFVTYWLVKLYGVVGAACGVVIIYILSSTFAVVALRQIFKPNIY